MVKITVSMQQEPVEVKTAQEAFDVLQSEGFFRAIGEFIFRFSQLEYQLKSTLASYLKLKGDQFDVIVGPYDFAMLCTVAEKTIKLDFDAEYHPALKAFFNRCRKLNQEVRVVVAHGSWSTGGARYATRQSLEAKMHFENPENLVKAAAEAVSLMDEFMQFGAVANS
jgi:cobalamin biosynthesis Co2+ chelatase CbiK